MLKPVALVTALSLTGCSFLFVRGPGDVGNPPTVYAECTTSLTWPAVDAGLGILWGLGAATTALRELEPDETEDERLEAMIAASILIPVVITSAVVGYRRTQRCEDSHAAFMAANPQGRQPYGYPGYPQQGYPQQGYPQQAPAGYEGGVCWSNGSCVYGLVCSPQRMCVRPAPAPMPEPSTTPAPTAPAPVN